MEIPQGTGDIKREVEANELVTKTMQLLCRAADAGIYISIENPFDSYLFKFLPVVNWPKQFKAQLVMFDQCAYGLQLPGFGRHMFCKKRTAVLTTMGDLEQLKAFCPGISATHMHEWAWGNRRVEGRSVKLSSSAGIYPQGLCKRWASIATRRLCDGSRSLDPAAPCLASFPCLEHATPT